MQLIDRSTGIWRYGEGSRTSVSRMCLVNPYNFWGRASSAVTDEKIYHDKIVFLTMLNKRHIVLVSYTSNIINYFNNILRALRVQPSGKASHERPALIPVAAHDFGKCFKPAFVSRLIAYFYSRLLRSVCPSITVSMCAAVFSAGTRVCHNSPLAAMFSG